MLSKVLVLLDLSGRGSIKGTSLKYQRQLLPTGFHFMRAMAMDEIYLVCINLVLEQANFFLMFGDQL